MRDQQSPVLLVVWLSTELLRWEGHLKNDKDHHKNKDPEAWVRWEQFSCCLLGFLANGLGSELEVTQCSTALETLKATAVISCLTRLLGVFWMLCWVLRYLLQDSISIHGTSCVDAVAPLTAAQGEFHSCAYWQTRWVRLSPTISTAEVPEVTSGLNLAFVLKNLWVLVWSWPELEEIFVEVSYCPSGTLAGCDDIPLKTLPCVLCGSMLLHPHPDWASFQ